MRPFERRISDLETSARQHRGPEAEARRLAAMVMNDPSALEHAERLAVLTFDEGKLPEDPAVEAACCQLRKRLSELETLTPS